ncbi:MAG TPA: hypothetical protein VID95_02375 [Candidatus Limnocylindrales bacterium]
MPADLARVEPTPPRIRRRLVPLRRRTWFALFLVVVLGAGAVGSGAIAVNAFGAGVLFQRLQSKIDRLIAGPPPDRATLPTVEVTDPPADTTPPGDSPSPHASRTTATSQPKPTPTPTPIPRVAVDVDIVAKHGPEFAHELRDDWCSPAGVTTALAILGLGAPTDAREREIASRIGEWDSYRDSHNGQWGPAAMALALDAYGAKGYQVVAFQTRVSALRAAAKAISQTNSPALLLAWRGAHTWVMTGYRADADPRFFKNANVTGAYVDDPWYPWNSSIWGQSDPPGTFQDKSEMVRNFLPWARPEGYYADRDGKFIVLIPTVPRP